MGSVLISYRLKLSEDLTEAFDFELDDESFDLISNEIENPPKWARLDYRQCPHCPLDPEETEYCPLALQLHGIVDRFHETRSIDEVEMEVITSDRRVIQKTALQSAIASMLDLIFPVCGCPKTEHFKPLARFHLPLASEEETVFRVTGMYLLAQYFLSVSRKGGSIEFDGLTDIYEDLHTLNVAVASRLQSATQSDSSKNAITLLDMYSSLVPMLLEDELAEMKGFFRAYIPEGEMTGVSTSLFDRVKELSLKLMPIEGESEEDEDDDRPDWLKQVRSSDDVEEETKDLAGELDKPEMPENESSEADRIIERSGLSISLAPIDENGAGEGTEEDKSAPDIPVTVGFGIPDDASKPPKERVGSAKTDESKSPEKGKKAGEKSALDNAGISMSFDLSLEPIESPDDEEEGDKKE